MSVENEPLRLMPHRLEVEAGGQWRLVTPAGETYGVPLAYHGFLRLVHSGASFSSLAHSLRAAGTRFSVLAKFLVFLNDRGLLADSRFVQLAEAFRPDYVWRGSIAFDELFSIELFKLSGRSSSPGIGTGTRTGLLFVYSIVVLFTGMLFWQRLAGLGAFWGQESQIAGAGLGLLLAFVVTFSAGRSLRALAQMLSFHSAGFRGALKFRIDSTSVSLSADDASRAVSAVSGGTYVAASFCALGFLFFPAAFAWGLPYGADSYLPFFAVLLLLAELSPFRQSGLTECLRALYVSMDKDRAKVDGSAEERIRLFHTVAATLWCLSLVAFLVWPARGFATHLFRTVGEFDPASKMGLAVVALGLLVIILSFVDDLLSGSGFGSDTRSIRKIWRRRKSGLQVNEAVQAGKIPSRTELEDLPLLRQMDPKSKAAMLKNAEVTDVEEGEEICRQGDTDRTLYIVLSGRLSVGKRASSGRRRALALLSPGAVFGEVAYFLGERRSADVHAVEPSRLLAIRHDDRISTLDRAKSEELQLRIRFLQALVGSPLFRELPADALDALVFSGEKRVFRAGEKVFSEGEAGDACYFIIQGEASAVQNFKPINRMKNGDAFGEIALLKPNLLRTATVAALTELITVRIDGEKLWSLLALHLPLAIELEALAEQRLLKDQQRAQT